MILPRYNQDMDRTIEQKIARFEAENKLLKVCFGGDGAIVSSWRDAVKAKKMLFPIRNYGMCEEHAAMLDDLMRRPEAFNDNRKELKLSLHPPVRCEFDGYDELALSEVLVTSDDITVALRFDVLVNGEKYLENVIATSVLAATEFGATGYWSSVTRTIFRDGIGLAFIAPTVGVDNLILKRTDKVEISFVRGCTAKVAADKLVVSRKFEPCEKIRIESSSENVPIIGLAQFHCNACRAKRSGTILSTQYLK